MFRKRKYVTEEEFKQLLPRIQEQCKLTYPEDTVLNDSFSIHKSLTNGPRHSRKFLNFHFTGTVCQSDGKTVLIYHVTPPPLWMAVYLLLCAIALHSVVQVLLGNGSMAFLLISVLFPCLVYGIAEWECTECVKAFNAKLK